jgi:hypothetical protein
MVDRRAMVYALDMIPRHTFALLALVAATPAAALADDAAPALHLDLAAAYVQPETAPEDAAATTADAIPSARISYGSAGSQWLTVGSGFAYDFDENADANVHVAWSTFLADEIEFGVEGALWGFFQQGDDTAGVSGSLLFRWHFLHDEAYDWTVFGDVGIGLLGAFDTVPDTGTGFNFLPRAGFGLTTRIDDESDTRLMLGARWHHISNGRIEGDARNPARDSVMLYAAVVFPF